MLRGDIMLFVLFLSLFLVSHMVRLVIDLYYEVIHGICLLVYVL